MLAKTIGSYGGVFIDAEAVENPATEQSADLGNRVFEDAAQMTRTVGRAKVKFQTSVDAAPVAITVLAGSRSIWGSGSGQYPTISKTATGTYVLTFAAEYDDALVGTTSNAVAETETVDLTFSHASVKGSNFGTAQTLEAGNVLTVYVFNGANPHVLSDLGGNVVIEVEAS